MGREKGRERGNARSQKRRGVLKENSVSNSNSNVVDIFKCFDETRERVVLGLSYIFWPRLYILATIQDLQSKCVFRIKHFGRRR